MSAFFGARAPELVPEHAQHLNLKPAQQRKILQEHSSSDLNKSNNGKPTIRLVDPNSSSPKSVYEKTPFPKLNSQVLKPTKLQTSLTAPAWIAVPATPVVEDEEKPVSRDGATALIPRPLQLKRNRMSASTTTSDADTLVADSMFSPTSQRFSYDAPSKRTPTPMDGDDRQDHLEPLQEQSRENLRAQEDTESQWSDVEEDEEDNARHSQHVRKESSASAYSNSFENDDHPYSRSSHIRRMSDSSELGFSAISEPAANSSALMSKGSRDSMTRSNRSGSTSHNIIRYASSSESIRPQYMSMRPATAQSHSASSLWSSDQGDNIAPLSMPKKRAHMHSASLGSYPSLPRAGASYLSTIASESERDFHRSSKFSQATGRASVATPSLEHQTWPRKRRTTISSSVYSGPGSSPELPQNSSEYSISTGSRPNLSRDDSAMPPPLFSSSQPITQREFQPREFTRGSSTDPAEGEDTIAELQAPVLRPQRSGYIVRQRSQTDLRPTSKQSSHSLADTNRWSQGSFIFPQWAKAFYRGHSGLGSANASRVTLASAGYASTNVSRNTLSRPNTRGKANRSEIDTPTAVSHATMPGSMNSNWETVATDSPASRFLPSIFRPRNRARAQTDSTHMRTESSRGSLSIYEESVVETPLGPIPKVQSRQLRQLSKRETRGDHPLRSHGAAQDLRAAARNQSCHSQILGQPMSSRANYVSFPHLVPNKRLSLHLSAWRVPSIDEPFPAEYLGRGNRQILAFCLGFLFPPIWILAACLSLPQRPVDLLGEDFNPEIGNLGSFEETDKQSVVILRDQWGWEDERRFLKARWWRTLNRIMSVVGIGIMAAIIALAVLAARGA